jgi:hypothetical protein
MFVELSDGRVFKTEKILEIDFNPQKKVYKYEFVTETMTFKSSSRHKWVVWNKKIKDLDLVEMKDLNKNYHEILIMVNKNV